MNIDEIGIGTALKTKEAIEYSNLKRDAATVFHFLGDTNGPPGAIATTPPFSRSSMVLSIQTSRSSKESGCIFE